MTDVLETIRERRSTRASYDHRRPVSGDDLRQIIDAARWAPTPHNMQNFEIVAVDDRSLLKKLGGIRSPVSGTFVRENYRQLSFSRAELLQKKVGILGSFFPPAWRDPGRFDEVLKEERSSTLNDTMDGCPTVLVVVYDPRKRAPASEGDFLGILGLGCVMENMWLAATSLKVSFQVMSVFGAFGGEVEEKVKGVLSIPDYMRIAYAIRLGYPVKSSERHIRARRNLEDVVHHNRYGTIL